MGILPDYDDDVERRHTHPALLRVLKRVMGSADIQENKRIGNSKSILPAINPVAK